MKRMGIEAMYKKPDTGRRHPAHAVYLYLLRHMEHQPATLRLGSRYHGFTGTHGLENASSNAGDRRLSRGPSEPRGRSHSR